MNKIVPEALIDCSTDTELSFAVCCEECGKRQLGERRRFSKAGIRPVSDGKLRIYQILYRREWEQLREETTRRLEPHFNLCPICHRLVCDGCVLVCDDLDMCRSCAELLQEKGRGVKDE